jgi:hypothetical protein
MYELYYEDELIASYNSMERIITELKELRLDAIGENRADMDRFPQFYPLDPSPEDGVDEWMRDVYSVKLAMEFPKL